MEAGQEATTVDGFCGGPVRGDHPGRGQERHGGPDLIDGVQWKGERESPFVAPADQRAVHEPEQSSVDLHLQPAGLYQLSLLAAPGQRGNQHLEPVPHLACLLEPLLAGQPLHPGLERCEEPAR